MLFHKDKDSDRGAVPKEVVYQKLKELEAAYDRHELSVEDYEAKKEILLEKLE